MVRIRFHGVLLIDPDGWPDDPRRMVDRALTYGDKHQDYTLYRDDAPLTVEDVDDTEESN
jgi:hypothetical protein